MAGKLTRAAYEQLVAENLKWLAQQPRTLEREHIRAIVEASAGHEYGTPEPAVPSDPKTRDVSAAIRDLWCSRENLASSARSHASMFERFLATEYESDPGAFAETRALYEESAPRLRQRLAEMDHAIAILEAAPALLALAREAESHFADRQLTHPASGDPKLRALLDE